MLISFGKFITEEKFSGTAYHGSNSFFSKFDAKKARIPNDFYGGGIAYFTTDREVGINYANGMAKKTGEPVLYEVMLRLKNIFDVDHKFTGKDLTKLIGDDVDSFARGASLLSYGVDTFAVLSSLKDGKKVLTGEQVFKGLSRGGITTAKTRAILIRNGYDGLRYNGGINMGLKRHDVFLAYHPESIKIIDRHKIKTI